MHRLLKKIPPAPSVVAGHYHNYLAFGKAEGISFKRYLRIVGMVDPAAHEEGMDDAARVIVQPHGPELVTTPTRRMTGNVQVMVLLVDFEDREGTLPPEHYQQMLFSEGTYATGSMHDFYKEVSGGKVKLGGFVHGWLRMPHPYSFYTNGESGQNWHSHPNNAPSLAEDAVKAALAAGVHFPQELDALEQGTVTALFIVHAGHGAETIEGPASRNEIWSHKWNFRNPAVLGAHLQATQYLMVPQDCKVGVCAHELGHLAFQWDDFYDPNYDEDGSFWDGSGFWDLMAGGSYNGNGMRPAHPAGLHKAQHGWVKVEEVRGSTSISLPPYSATSGKVVRVVSPVYEPKQYLLLENRAKVGFDKDLPGNGLLVWRVDERKQQTSANAPALLLIQADGRHDLERGGGNAGDPGDPFPGSSSISWLSDIGPVSTSFPGQGRSRVRLQNIKLDPATGVVTLDVVM